MLVFLHVSSSHKLIVNKLIDVNLKFLTFSFIQLFCKFQQLQGEYFMQYVLKRTNSWLVILVVTDLKKRACILHFLCDYGSDPQNSHLNLGSRRLEKENQLLALYICKVTLARKVVRILCFSSWKVYKSYFIHIKF